MANLIRNGGGGGRGVASVSIGAGRSSMDPGAPSVLYGGGGVASTATCSTTAAEPTGLTARLPTPVPRACQPRPRSGQPPTPGPPLLLPPGVPGCLPSPRAPPPLCQEDGPGDLAPPRSRHPRLRPPSTATSTGIPPTGDHPSVVDGGAYPAPRARGFASCALPPWRLFAFSAHRRARG